MTSRNKRRIYITIHHRGAKSLGKNRTDLHLSAFHWGILLAPKAFDGGSNDLSTDCTKTTNGTTNGTVLYDVTNSLMPFPDDQLNTSAAWYFRSRRNVNLRRDHNLHIIGRIMIGKVPAQISDAEIETVLADEVPLPDKGAVPPEDCVTWTRNAVRCLQEERVMVVAGAGPGKSWFDVWVFMEWCLGYADRCLAELDPLRVCEYPLSGVKGRGWRGRLR